MLGSAGELDAKAMLNLSEETDMTSTDLPSWDWPVARVLRNASTELAIQTSERVGVEGKTGFIQLGDVIDRADHSELA